MPFSEARSVGSVPNCAVVHCQQLVLARTVTMTRFVVKHFSADHELTFGPVPGLRLTMVYLTASEPDTGRPNELLKFR